MLVAGRVLQPWHVDGSRPLDGLASERPGYVEEFIGCNFSVNRSWAVALGGFDERFVRVAYRYEAEFGERAKRTGARIRFLPEACIRHLRVARGGTRSYGEHLRSMTPDHSVGQYYYLLRAGPSGWLRQFVAGPFRAVITRFHLRHPWWIPVVFIGHLSGVAWAILLWLKGPQLLSSSDTPVPPGAVLATEPLRGRARATKATR
jgi:GT2 family glycosyltransferase